MKLQYSQYKPDQKQKDSGIFQDYLKNKLVVSTRSHFHFIDIEKILYLNSESNYCKVVLKNGKSIFSSKTLKIYEAALKTKAFFRANHSYLINLDKIIAIRKNGEYKIVLNNGEEIIISRKYKENILTNLIK